MHRIYLDQLNAVRLRQHTFERVNQLARWTYNKHSHPLAAGTQRRLEYTGRFAGTRRASDIHESFALLFFLLVFIRKSFVNKLQCLILVLTPLEVFILRSFNRVPMLP